MSESDPPNEKAARGLGGGCVGEFSASDCLEVDLR